MRIPTVAPRRRKPLAVLLVASVLALTLTPLLGLPRTEEPADAAPPPPTIDAGPAPVDGLSLPRIPWEGGPAYYRRFAKPDAAGWDSRSFFPVVLWFNGISNAGEVKYDRSLGFNTYVGMDPSTPYSLFRDHDAYWIGDSLNSGFNDASTNWVGSFLGDEYDGAYSVEEGLERLQQAKDENAGSGRIGYANFTQMVISEYLDSDLGSRYVNDFTDTVSLDMYWYTIPFCDWTPYQDIYLAPVRESNCRTASSYGRTMDSLRMVDARDGELQPLWQFVEILNGGPGEGPFVAYITPGQLRGAVMSSVINEARGLVYFNQSLSGSCRAGSAVRQSQVDPNFCGAAQVRAAGRINNQIHRLARVINTQSYRWRFGRGLDTMLKATRKHVYVFAMVDGKSRPGTRRLRLPPEVEGRTAKVLFEKRSIPIGRSGRFTDTFEAEYSYHVYRIAR